MMLFLLETFLKKYQTEEERICMRNSLISSCIFLKWLPRSPCFLAPISSDRLHTLGPRYFPLFCLISLSLLLRVHQFLSTISTLPQFIMLLILLLPWLVLHALPHASTCSYINSPLEYFRKPTTAFMQKFTEFVYSDNNLPEKQH